MLHHLLTLGFALSAIFVFWTLSATSSSPFARNFPRLREKRICLLIAHPDDEAMFFAPTVLALTRPELGNHLKILCLSSGDADGLGHVRTQELKKSAMQLGLRDESDVFIVDDPSRFQDSMSATWSENDISALLASAFAPPSSNTSTSSSVRKRNKNSGTDPADAPSATIDALITFDAHGISNHPNHRSLYHGAVHFLRSLMKGKAGYSCPVTLYTLTSTSIFRKYLGILDAPLTMAKGALRSFLATLSRNQTVLGAKDDLLPSQLLFISDVREWLAAQGAMVNAHKSQMVWFRWGWISLGRYMAVNDLRKEKMKF